MAKINASIKITGIVQGVGFRPFVHKLVRAYHLTGFIRNTSFGVELELEGEEEAVDSFLAVLEKEPPVLAMVEDVYVQKKTELQKFIDFQIVDSFSDHSNNALVSPDIAICDDCLKELFDPSDRRYRYPFINCTNCGPRFTIVKDIPYDRDKTTMANFSMCEKCSREYGDIGNRRYHAQPDCCPDCGPEIFFADQAEALRIGGEKEAQAGAEEGKSAEQTCVGEAALARAVRYLAEGKIVAVKGLGGFHLACRIDDEQLVKKLRQKKQRDEKPFAVMVGDLSAARALCKVSEAEEKALTDPKRPIVLLQKKDPNAYPYISENTDLGVMLPYTPLHYLLFDAAGMFGEVNALIMTSANLSDEPVIYENEEALLKLERIADGFLLHDRPIETRCDDSLIRIFEGQEYPVRRSRGYVPYPLRLPEINAGDVSVLACGAEQKASFAMTKADHIFLSQHIGDLKNLPTLKHYEQQIRHFERLFSIRPEIFACDLHPDYLSSDYAGGRAEQEAADGGAFCKTKASNHHSNPILFRVQHHHAHMAACMADNGLTEPCIGIIWDGTGAGARTAAQPEGRIDYAIAEPVPDGTVWGGEFLVGDYSGFRRVGSLLPFRLPGGDKVTKELWRTAISLVAQTEQMMDQSGAAGILPTLPLEQNCQTGDLKTLFPDKPVEQILTMLEHQMNSPVCTSMGRLFDGIACLLGIRDIAGYEGQGAVLLEACGWKAEELSNDDCFSYDLLQDGLYRFDFRPMIKEILEAAPHSEQERNRLARRFMNTMVDMATEMTRRIAADCGLNKVVLSGGSFQNQYMLTWLVNRLRGEGFEVFCHRQIAPNDEGLSVGQAMVAKAASLFPTMK